MEWTGDEGCVRTIWSTEALAHAERTRLVEAYEDPSRYAVRSYRLDSGRDIPLTADDWHRKGSNACAETCGKGQTPSAVEQRPPTAADYYTSETEFHYCP